MTHQYDLDEGDGTIYLHHPEDMIVIAAGDSFCNDVLADEHMELAREMVRRANAYSPMLDMLESVHREIEDVLGDRSFYGFKITNEAHPWNETWEQLNKVIAEAKGQPAPIYHPLPVDTKIRSIGGAAQGDWDTDEDDDGDAVERRAAPGETAKIVYRNKGKHGWIYGVVFDECNAWIHLDEAEINDRNKYEVLP